VLDGIDAIWRDVDLPGRLIVFEGFDGAGKTTQIEALRDRCQAAGEHVLLTRQPSDWYRQSPEVIAFLKSGGTPETARILALFAAADRLRHCAQVIRPALEQGITVISDRYVFSSIAFFRARGLDPAFVATINTGVLRPDAAFYLDVPPEVTRARLLARDGDQLKHEEKSAESIARIMGYFKDISPALDVVPAHRPIAEVAQDIWRRIAGA